MASGLTWLVLTTGSVSCAARFEATPAIPLKNAAFTQADHVRLSSGIVDSRRRPCACPQLVPIRVTIHNDSEHVLSVYYENIALRPAAGPALRPLPAFDLGATNLIGMPVSYAYPWSGFHLAAPLGRYYRGFWNSAAAAERDATYFKENHAKLAAIVAPGPKIVRVALPEGDLEPDGHISGVLYFLRPGAARRATLSATLTTPEAAGRGVVLELGIELVTEEPTR